MATPISARADGFRRRRASARSAAPRIRSFAGATFVHEALTKANIPHEFIPVPKSPHNHDQLLQFEAFDTMAFYAGVFGRAK